MNNLLGQENIQTGEKSVTQVNPNAVAPGAGGTIVNPNASVIHRSTAVNPNATAPGAGGTVVNPNAVSAPQLTNSFADANLGTVVNGKYTLTSRLNTNSGEAEIYICVDDAGRELCLKHYIRLDRIREEVRKRLHDLHFPFVAELIDWGYWNDRLYEVWPVYSQGSLEGKRLDEKANEAELYKYIAQMNAALRAIHEKGIVHQDIKPSNFVLAENKNLVLIDFGVSAILDSEGEINRTHVTEVGGTPGYKAPEVRFDRCCGIPSDYYSMGATIYAMLFGTTPYQNNEAVSLTVLIDAMSKTSLPEIMTLSPRMQHLLTGLLQFERHKRWSFDAVCDWLNNDYQKWIIDPVDHFDTERGPVGYEPMGKKFKFDGNIYSLPAQLPELVTNMAYRWSLGQNLFGADGRFERLKETLKDVEGTEDIYAICNAPKQRGEDDAINYFRKLYQLYPGLKLFTWKQYQYENKVKLGDAILNALWAKEIEVTTAPASKENTTASSIFSTKKQTATFPSYAELLFWMRNGVVSLYLDSIGEKELAEKISKVEATADSDPKACYTIAYMLSGSKKFRLPSGTFNDKEDFLRFVKGKIDESERSGDVSAFLNFCKNEIYDGKTINIGFQAWIETLGLGDTLTILTDSNFSAEVSANKSVPVKQETAPRASQQKEEGKRVSEQITVKCPICNTVSTVTSTIGVLSISCPTCHRMIDKIANRIS